MELTRKRQPTVSATKEYPPVSKFRNTVSQSTFSLFKCVMRTGVYKQRLKINFKNIFDM